MIVPLYGDIATPKEPIQIPELNLEDYRANGYWFFRAIGRTDEYNFWRCAHMPSEDTRIITALGKISLCFDCEQRPATFEGLCSDCNEMDMAVEEAEQLHYERWLNGEE